MGTLIDLRSDTVTQPTEAMRRAMAKAEVGDNYYGDDPTVARLEQLAAELLGKEAGLFVASGTMANLVSILTHCNLGDAIIVEENAHCIHNETGNIAALAGVMPHPLPGQYGVMDPKQITKRIVGNDVLNSRTKLICIENTHNVSGGTIWPMDQLNAVWEVAREHNLKTHIDGARTFNAAVGLNIRPESLASGADSLTFCLTKGLCCPFGSVIVGTREFIHEAARYRQMTGGGMRQGGVMAAAGIVALETMIDRLAEDHETAQALAHGLVALGLSVDLAAVQTNMVYAALPEGTSVKRTDFQKLLASKGILINDSESGRFRFVTHYGIADSEIQYTLVAVEQILNA